MSKIVIDREKFAYLVMSFLLDNLLHEEDMIIENDDWDLIMRKVKMGGLKSHLMNAYVKMDGERRVEYKRIKKVFYEDSPTQYVINIQGQTDLKEDTTYKYKLKDLLREAIRLVEKEKKKTGFTVNGEKVDRIIEHVINKQQQFEKGE